MYTDVSNAWVEAHKGYLAPEGFIEITFHVPKLGQTLVFTKGDLLSFTHTQTGSVVSGELPKNHIEFSLDNSDDKWNPKHPKGPYRYLSERLRITLRYGFDVLNDGNVEWIDGGTFYLSEWYTPANGLEASFKARDALEFMLDDIYTGEVTGTLYELANNAVRQMNKIPGFVMGLSAVLKDYTVADIEYNGNESVAEILQKCANAAKCVMCQWRNGILVIQPLDYTNSGYTITSNLAYSYPEIEYSRPLKQIIVTYGDGSKQTLNYGSEGEAQTLDNNFISTASQAVEVGQWVVDALKTRMTIGGEFRGDTRLDLFDVVNVESKYGTINNVVLTEIKYTFTGAFRATYKGHIRGIGVVAELFSGEVFSGEWEDLI